MSSSPTMQILTLVPSFTALPPVVPLTAMFHFPAIPFTPAPPLLLLSHFCLHPLVSMQILASCFLLHFLACVVLCIDSHTHLPLPISALELSPIPLVVFSLAVRVSVQIVTCFISHSLSTLVYAYTLRLYTSPICVLKFCLPLLLLYLSVCVSVLIVTCFISHSLSTLVYTFSLSLCPSS